MAMDFPSRAFGTMAIGRRVEDDRFVLHVASKFTLYKGNGVVDDPTNGGFYQIGMGTILTSPGDGRFGSVDVRYGATRASERECGGTCVGE